MLFKQILTATTLATGLTSVLALDNHGTTSLEERRNNEPACPDCTNFCGEGKDPGECRLCLDCIWPTDVVDDENHPDLPDLKPRENCDAPCGPHGNTQACGYCKGSVFLTPPAPFAVRGVDPSSRKDCSQPCGPHGSVMDCAWCRGGVFLPPSAAVERKDVDSDAHEDASSSDEASVANPLFKRKDCHEYCGHPGKSMDCAWCRSWRQASSGSEGLDTDDNITTDLEQSTVSDDTAVQKRDEAQDPAPRGERNKCDKWCKKGPHVDADLCAFCETGIPPWPVGEPAKSMKREESASSESSSLQPLLRGCRHCGRKSCDDPLCYHCRVCHRSGRGN